MEKTRKPLMELDRLKGVYRKSWITAEERPENSAEHSWHIAVALLAFKKIIPESVDLDHAIRTFAPEIYAWIEAEIDEATRKGWLVDA